MNYPEFKVVCRCITYNQANYITDTMDGFCMQQTDFPYICCIWDDASTDGEPEVIRKYVAEHFDLKAPDAEQLETDYAHITYARHRTNRNCFFLVFYLKENHYQKGMEYKKIEYAEPWIKNAPYFALCEGDDYWTDVLKLQRQVDYLNTHLECGLVYAKARRYSQKDKVFVGEWGRLQDYESLLFKFSDIPTLTAMYRGNLAREYDRSRQFDPLWPIGDVPLWLWFMYKSKVKFLDEYVGVYRMLEQSACRLADPYRQTAFYDYSFKCRAFYARRYWGDELAQRVDNYRISTLLDKIMWTETGGYHLTAGDLKNAKICSGTLWVEWFCSRVSMLRAIYRWITLVRRSIKYKLFR